ncbi:MAG: hypothetical protein OER85_04490 [Gammaproteobacteria bacterium]|nr:hypothetical protein [Gammaproteobacteria bacterium]
MEPKKRTTFRLQRLVPNNLESVIPLLITVSILLAGLLLRIGATVVITGARCYPLNEYLFGSANYDLPLVGSFILVFTLLFIWNGAVVFSPLARSLSNRIILGLNALAIVAIGLGIASMFKAGEISHLRETGAYEPWLISQPGLFQFDECEAAKPFLGRWQIESIQLSLAAAPFPDDWIEFRRDLTIRAAFRGEAQVVKGNWQPPGMLGTQRGWISGTGFGAAWHFTLDGEQLVLEKPKDVIMPEAEVRLRREQE